MRFKGTIFLTLLLILLGVYLYLIELPSEKKKTDVLLQEGKLYNFELHEISRLTVRNPQGEMEIEYFPGHPASPWRIFHPIETIADQNAANELAMRLMNLKFSRLVEALPTELKDFGLDPAPYRVLITLNQTNTEILEIGGENLTGSDVYVRKGEGTSLYLVPAGIKELLNKDLTAWRQREIFPFASEDILEIQLTSPRGHLKLSKEKEDWRMESQSAEKEGGNTLTVRGNRGEIANLLGSIVNFRGSDFIDFKKNQWKENFGPPLMKLTLKVSKVEREAIFYKDGINPDLVYVLTNDFDPIFQITDADLRSIDQSFEIYRDRHLVALDFPEQIQTLKIKRPEGSFSLTKKEDRWWFTKDGVSNTPENGGSPREVKSERISQVLTNLYHLRLETFQDELKADTPETGLKNPQMTLHLQDKNGDSLGKMDFGRIEKDSIYGKSTGQPHPFLLKKSFLEQIPHEKDFFPAAEAGLEHPAS